MLTWGWRKNDLQVKRNAWEYQGAMIKTIWSWGMAWELWQPETWHSEMVQALLAANSQGAELQRLMVEGALQHVSLWMTWEPMRNVLQTKKIWSHSMHQGPIISRDLHRWFQIPRLPMVSLCAFTWECHRHHLKLSEFIVLQGRSCLGEIHQNDVRGPFFLNSSWFP